MKNMKAGVIPSNYRKITCLYTTFKLMTAIIADTIQNHLYKYSDYNFMENIQTVNGQVFDYVHIRRGIF